MKQSIYHLSEHQFPVNHLKGDTELTEAKSNAGAKKAGAFFEGKATLPWAANSLNNAIHSTNTVGNTVELSRSGVLFLMRMLRLVFSAFRNWVAPYHIKGIAKYQRFVETAAGYSDAFFNFMETFLFLDEAVLQPAVISQTNKPSQSRQFVSDNGQAMNSGKKKRFFKAFAADQRNDVTSSFIGSNKKPPVRRFNLTIFPKIKLPLKTNNPDLWPPRLLFHYPAVEFLQLIFSRCIKLFRLNPKHLNAGLKEYFKPVFNAVN